MENKDGNSSASAATHEIPHDVLVVTSKLKNYIKEKSAMNTAGNVPEALSDRIRTLCDQAIDNARRDGRKTVMDRDFPALT
jgi:histone H3/H4